MMATSVVTPRALSSRATSRGSAGSMDSMFMPEKMQDENVEKIQQDVDPEATEPFKPLQTWTRLRHRELAPMPDVEALLGIGPAVSFGHGLLWPGCFQQYAIGWMPGMSLSGVHLSAAELGKLLREQRINLDYMSRSRVLELAAGRGAQSIDFLAFLHLVEETARSATFAEDLLANEGPRRRKPEPPEEVAMAVVRAVFNSYDSSKAGELTRQDYMRILRDRNQVPRTADELRDFTKHLAFCREDGLPGSLDFVAFMRFVVFLSGK